MNPPGLLLLPQTASPDDTPFRCYQRYLQPSQRRRRNSILDRGLEPHDSPLADLEGCLLPASSQRD